MRIALMKTQPGLLPHILQAECHREQDQSEDIRPTDDFEHT